MILSKEQAKQIIPQKDPFVMVGELLEAAETKIVSNFTIEKNNILLENNTFTTEGLIENIAQTCALGFGYLAKKNNQTPSVGFIGSISKLKTFNTVKSQQTIKTFVDIVTTFENITLIKGKSFFNDEKLIECEMKIVITNE